MRVARRFLLLGGAFLAGSAAAVAAGNLSVAVGLAVIGLVALLAGRRFRTMEPGSIQRGIPGTAEIRSARETGTKVDQQHVVVEVTATVSIAEFVPYEAVFRVVLHPTQIASVRPGSQIPVLVEADRPTRIVLDADRVALARPGPFGDRDPSTPRLSADAVIEHGVAVEGTLHFSGPTGLVARDLVPHLRGPEADDPIHQVVVSFKPLGGKRVRTEFLVRVPHDAALPTRPGSPLPIKYLPGDPSIATIDWSRR